MSKTSLKWPVFLSRSGFSVTLASNGLEGIKASKDQDIMIVDVMMPVTNGFQMMRKLREQGVSTPAIMLTARDSLEDRVKGLDLGADDYLVKPFKLPELLARIRAILRRSRLSQDVVEFDDLWMDTRARKVKRSGQWVALSNTEFAILELFMLEPGTFVSRQHILREVWGEDGPRNGNVVEVYLNYLRSKLETGGKPRLIHTVRGKGYILRSVES